MTAAPRVAVTPGDPAGIGPEVAVAGLAAIAGAEAAGQAPAARWVLLGDCDLWERAARSRGLALDALPSVAIEAADPAADSRYAHLPEIAALATAIEGCKSQRFDALCTAPLHKASLLERGFPLAGHTPYLAERCGLAPDEAVMVFASDELVVSLATGHIPLVDVPRRLDAAALIRAARAGAQLLEEGLGRPAPRIALCGLNPHAGESGRMGVEEDRVHRPAIEALRVAGYEASGPYSADSLFARAVGGEFDLVVACYHDQGLIPIKTRSFGRSVHVTGGLPIVRTSVDHGTARDIAWQGRADAGPMEKALGLAARLAAGHQAAARGEG